MNGKAKELLQPCTLNLYKPHTRENLELGLAVVKGSEGFGFSLLLGIRVLLSCFCFLGFRLGYRSRMYIIRCICRFEELCIRFRGFLWDVAVNPLSLLSSRLFSLLEGRDCDLKKSQVKLSKVLQQILLSKTTDSQSGVRKWNCSFTFVTKYSWDVCKNLCKIIHIKLTS